MTNEKLKPSTPQRKEPKRWKLEIVSPDDPELAKFLGRNRELKAWDNEIRADQWRLEMTFQAGGLVSAIHITKRKA
jgi:hypothetical protein